jgi:tagatose-1,6-bisphosphate aldolase
MAYVGILLIAILVSFIIVRIWGFALELTGIEPDVARFQALSAFSGTGFTTREAERVVGNKIRRRIVAILIILGNAGTVTVIATLVASSTQVSGYTWFFIRLAIIIGGIFVLYQLIMRSNVGRRIPAWLQRPVMNRILRGAPAVKLLIYFRPDLKNIASKQLDLVAGLADQCLEEDIAFLVESVSYPIEEERINQGGTSSRKFAEIKPGLVIETARQITALPIDVLKAEFPADIKFEQDEGKLLGLCKELNRASRLPWVLLSAGVDFESFRKQVKIACKAGASGFLAGRALWQEGVRIRSREKRLDFFQNTAVPRLKELAEIADIYGKPWYSRLGAEDGKFVPLAEGWYRDY